MTKIYDILDFTRMLQASEDSVPVCLIDEAALMALPGFVPEHIGRAAAGQHSSSSSSSSAGNIPLLSPFFIPFLSYHPPYHPPSHTLFHTPSFSVQAVVVCHLLAVVFKAMQQLHR